MGHGAQSVYSVSIASGASTSSGINLARSWDNMCVEVSTMSTAAVINIFHSNDGGSTYYQLFAPTVNTSTVTANAVAIATSVGSGGGVIVLPFAGVKYIQFRTTSVVSGGVNIKVVGGD